MHINKNTNRDTYTVSTINKSLITGALRGLTALAVLLSYDDHAHY